MSEFNNINRSIPTNLWFLALLKLLDANEFQHAFVKMQSDKELSCLVCVLQLLIIAL